MTKVIDMKHLQMITMMCVICVTASCTTQKIAYRERFEDAKGYALYACIAHMNKFVDSTSFINKDYKQYASEYYEIQVLLYHSWYSCFMWNTGADNTMLCSGNGSNTVEYRIYYRVSVRLVLDILIFYTHT